MTVKPRKRYYCRTCGAEFESKAGKLPCSKPTPGKEFVDTGRGGHMFSLDKKSGAKPRKHRNKLTRVTAAERVEMYETQLFGATCVLSLRERKAAIKMLRDHARETLARERRRAKAAT